MENQLSPRFKNWMKKCLKDEFTNAIDEYLNGDRDPYDVAQKIINSSQMTELTNAIRTSFIEQLDVSKTATRPNSSINSTSTSRPPTSLSYDEFGGSSGDDWSLKGSMDNLGQIVDQMGYDKPDHVRLAGYEALFENELANMMSNDSWDALLKTLRDGLIDDSRSIFEVSLLVHSKLLKCPKFSEVYMNVLNAFMEQYQSRKLFDTLPTILSGVNFKIFLHEKLFRVMRLILDHQEEILKGTRTIDKLIEDMIEQFISFLCSNSVVNTAQTKPINMLHIISVLEPQAGWSKKWMHSLITRKTLCTAISKSPSLIQNIVTYVKKGLENPPTGFTIAITDASQPPNVFISGDTVETCTFLHCLNLLTQLCSFSTGRALLLETQSEDSFSVPDFLTALLSSLNVLAYSEASNSIYEAIRAALYGLLRKSIVLYDARFYQVALNPLMKSEIRIWPHTLDVLSHMLNTADGPTFLMTECRTNSASYDNKNTTYPVKTIISYASNLLRQPVAVMSIEHTVDLFKFIGKLFNNQEIFYIVEEIVRETFYPSVTYMYSKLDKYYVENENKTQHLDRAVKEMLLNIVAIPLGLQMLSNEPLIFEELIRGSIAPVRASWSNYDIVSFISNSGFLTHGVKILLELAPHVLSTTLVELDKILTDPQQFHDPWESVDVKVFVHVLTLFSLNTNCFLTFMTTENEANTQEESEYPTNLFELFQYFLNFDSPYHHLGLLSLKAIIWNLDIYIFLLNLLDFQEKLLQFQEHESFIKDDGPEIRSVFIIDECSLMRHTILLSCYYVRHKKDEPLTSSPEEARLFSTLPPPAGVYDDFIKRSSSQSELSTWLQDSGPGLRDSSWVSQTRKAHKASAAPMKTSVLFDLLDQMEQAIETVEWVDHFKWNPNLELNDDYWFPEDLLGIDLVVHYGVLNGQLEKNQQIKDHLKLFIQSSHNFINYNKSLQFEGFDWFLATIFLICNGDVEKSKTFLYRILHFPSTMFMWPALTQVIDDSNEEEASTKLLFAHLLEGIISLEFPTLKFALRRKCGVDWWMICDRLLAQCFLGILPWSEIVHYFAICILHSPDYVLYYCASLLNHCEDEMMKSITNGKIWPEDMILEDYRCHSQIGFMDRLGKRHGGKVLPPLIQRKLNISDNDNLNSAN